MFALRKKPMKLDIRIISLYHHYFDPSGPTQKMLSLSRNLGNCLEEKWVNYERVDFPIYNVLCNVRYTDINTIFPIQ